MSETNFEVHMEHLKELMMKFSLIKFAQFLWTLKFIFSSSHGNFYSVLFQATLYIFSF